MPGDSPCGPLTEADQILLGESEAAGDLVQAYNLYGKAADGGSGLAAHRLAVLNALGIGRVPAWDESLKRLRQAAELGHPTANQQLRLIEGTELFPPAARAIAVRDPAIVVVKKLVSPDVCRWIRASGHGRLAAAHVNHVSTGTPTSDPMRTARAAHFQLFDVDVVLALTLERVARATGLPVHHFEPANLLHYSVGQQYRPHFDFIDPAVPGFRDQLSIFGQRIATVLVYLNDDYEGGETAFPALGYRFRGRPGDALVFFSVGNDGQPHRGSLHAGLPPTRGEKWVLSIWVRDRVQPIL